MFEQTLIEARANSKKPFALLLSLLLQVTALAILIAAPLIYTQVLPKAQLRSVFAAPAPPPPSPPKPPALLRAAAPPSFRLTALDMRIRPLPKIEGALATPPTATFDTGLASDIYSTGVPLLSTTVEPPDPQLAPAVKKPANKPLRIASMEASQLLHKVQPSYPPMAKMTHVQGIVEFTATISKTGSIENLQLVRGNPLLVKAAQEAIVQWKYKPTLLNGEPVEVITDILVNFTLTQ